MRAHSFSLKPTDYCNLACDYCYSPNSKRRNSIDAEAINALVDRMVSDFPPDQQFLIVWHGSEPLAVGQDFYDRTLGLFRETLGTRVRHHIQTNLTMLDDEWCEFLQLNKVSVSTSIDGPKSIHDTHRRGPTGKGSFDTVLGNILKLKNRRVPVSAILVLTKTTLPHIDGVYALLQQLAIPIRINPVLLPLNHPGCLPPEAYGEFVIGLAKRWLKADVMFDLEPVREIVLRLVSGKTITCDQEALCYRHLTGVATDGSLYPCNRFIGVPGFRLGHITDTTLPSVPSLPLSKKTEMRHVNSPKCQACRLLHVCNGGCMYHAHVIYGNAFKEDYFCQSYLLLTEFVLANLAKLLRHLGRIAVDPSLDAVAASADVLAREVLAAEASVTETAYGSVSNPN
ncbi:radical SAM protein [Bradyrhizobium sp. AUGA SZCCT0158]|uniref:radical SAM/SPASM domain-containing protein n=1 Tax=Bradyrhizobium sp. AUGA SZCCT0158 TaxID=2807661 RepID=UPI001BADC227|nr:radical SAM protein [Bradyrhizobium sp. AUGA SZCCT0158]MBR1201044.1 radical SAM protein [Bradyrhizobium sp. AUGA SZCCT0158]